jgi:steroid delta-isomerase-like uncharacterized protein
MAADPRAIVERLVELFKTNDASAAADIYADDVIIDDPMYGHAIQGRSAALQAFTDWFKAFRILDFDIVDSIVQGTRIAVHWQWTAIHQGEFLGVAPSGREFHGWHLMFFDTKNGQISRDLTCWDCTQFFALRKLSDESSVDQSK